MLMVTEIRDSLNTCEKGFNGVFGVMDAKLEENTKASNKMKIQN